MHACDFEYAGISLSEFGFVICSFGGSSGAEPVTGGSSITFNKVSRNHGKRHSLTSANYGECITASFDICKNPDLNDDELEISDNEVRDIMRWLNRREFLPFIAYDDTELGKDKCYYLASFNVEKIVSDDAVVGLRLNMETNSPFGYGEEQELICTIDDNSIVYTDVSDEIGYIYPRLEITCEAAGSLQLNNDRMDTPMIINNCANGEIITVDGENQIISSSVSSHNIMNDFNFNFFRIINSYENRVNVISSSIPITLKMSYTPIIKNAI